VNQGKNELKYNGAAYSPARVEGGQYSFWTYEHLLHRGTLGGAGLAVASQLAQRILTADASVSGILISAMKVHKTSDGGPIQPGGAPPNTP